VLAALVSLTRATILARVLLLTTLPAGLVTLNSDAPFLLRPSYFTLVMMAVLALLSCIGRPPRRWQLMATGIGTVGIASWLAFGPFRGQYFPRGGLIDLIASAWPVVVLLITATVFVLRARRTSAAAVMAASAPWLALLIADVFWLYTPWMEVVGVERVFVVKLAVVGALAVIVPVAILLVVRRYARPPWLSPSESSDSRTSASRPSSTR
jgi:hypothetical protein